MEIRELITKEVNASRGGYRPPEVSEKMVKAYNLGAENAREDFKRKMLSWLAG